MLRLELPIHHPAIYGVAVEQMKFFVRASRSLVTRPAVVAAYWLEKKSDSVG